MPVSSPSPRHLWCQHVCVALLWTRARKWSGFQSSTAKSVWYMASFQNVNEFQKTTTVGKCAHIGISCAGWELVSWSDWKHRIFPSRAFSDLCLHMLGRMGEFWMRIQLSRNSSLLLQGESKGFWDENSEDDPPHRFEKISWKIPCSHK